MARVLDEGTQVIWFMNALMEAAAAPKSKPGSSATPEAAPKWEQLSRHDCLLLESQFRADSKADGCTIRGGMFDVDVGARLARPVYWQEHPRRVLRGTWFAQVAGGWGPLLEADAAEVEDGLQKILQMAPRPPGAPELLRVALKSGQHDAVFFSPSNIRLVDRSIASKLLTMLTTAEKTGAVLRRGGLVVEPPAEAIRREEWAASIQRNVRHLVLVVHGIGQRLQDARFTSDVDSLNKCTTAMAEVYCRERYASSSILFLPIQWRRTLQFTFDAEPGSSNVTLDEITPKDLSVLRELLNGTAIDAMMYLTPRHQAAVLRFVRSEMNRVRNKFVERNPEFERNSGRVSILGHSLGSVIAFDMLTGMHINEFTSLSTEEPDDDDELCRVKAQMRELELEVDRLKSIRAGGQVSAGDKDKRERGIGLDFDVDTLFCMGSPLGVFLSLRECKISPDRGARNVYPCVRKMYNINHPSDPVAYRLEPFIVRSMASVPPALMAYHKGGKRLHLGALELKDDIVKQTEALSKSYAPKPTAPSRTSFRTFQKMTLSAFGKSVAEPEIAPTAPAPAVPLGMALLDTLTDGRMDYVMQENPMVSSYVQALGAHTNYWYENDVSLFILAHLLDLPASALAAAVALTSSSAPNLAARASSSGLSASGSATLQAPPTYTPPLPTVPRPSRTAEPPADTVDL